MPKSNTAPVVQTPAPRALTPAELYAPPVSDNFDPSDPNKPSALPDDGDKLVTGEEPGSMQWQEETQTRIAAALASADELTLVGNETPREVSLKNERDALAQDKDELTKQVEDLKNQLAAAKKPADNA